jgi:hypothetical protein
MDLATLKAGLGGVDVHWQIESTPEQVRQVVGSAIDSAGSGRGLS